jgi:hypothetical protein
MSGEEFNAVYRPLPGHTPDLYGQGEPGTGAWLYASWLKWDQLEDESHRDMFEDVKRMLAIRREHRDLIHAVDPVKADIELRKVPAVSAEVIPVPYLLSNGERALLVIGNPGSGQVEVELELSLNILGFPEGLAGCDWTELWPEEQPTRRVTVEELSRICCTIPADYERGGGLRVVRLDRIE